MPRNVSDARLVVGQPFIFNSRFEKLPTFVAATTTNQRWIDGTATGSLTNSSYGWGAPNITSSAAVSFDTTTTHNGFSSIKLESLDATGVSAVSTYRATPNGYAWPVSPNTTYKLRAWAKCTNKPAGGVNIALRTLTSTYTTISTNTSNLIGGTTDWTQLEVIYTTEANAAFVVPLLRDTAGLIGSAWFTEIELLPVTRMSRTSVT